MRSGVNIEVKEAIIWLNPPTALKELRRVKFSRMSMWLWVLRLRRKHHWPGAASQFRI